MSDLFLLKNTEIIDLFEIKLNDFEGYFRFHGSKNAASNVVFKGNEYLFIPCEISNLEYSSDGKQNRPTLSIANVNNFISNLLKDRNDLLGKQFYRKKVLAKDLDSVNFGSESKNPLGQESFVDFISIDSFVIHKKNSSNREKVEFELANKMDIDGQTAPTRKVYNDSCQFKYRGCGCNYGKLTGWSGAKIQIRANQYATLAEIISGEGITGLSCHLMSNTGVTFTGTTSYAQKTWDKLTAWADQSGSPKTIALAGAPKRNTNIGRVNNIQGILFGTSDTLQISHNYNTDITVFYVSEMVNKGTGSPNLRMGLGVADKSWFVGYSDGTAKGQDGCKSNSSFISALDGVDPKLDILKIFALVAPTSSSNPSSFYRDGSLIAKKTGFTNSPNNMGINLSSSDSNIVLYELIIFESLLSQTAVRSVTSYLGHKYGVKLLETATTYQTKTSAEFFTSYPIDGDLGVPIADENNKIFMGPASSDYSNGSSYGLETMAYKGDYDPNTYYSKGDFVKIDPQIDYDFNESSSSRIGEIPSRFFVLITDGASGKNPFKHTTDWVEDKCSFNLNGCSLRFKDLGRLPMGAFPGTVTYDYKLPG